MIINKILSHCLPTIPQDEILIPLYHKPFFIFGFSAFKTEKKTIFVKSFLFLLDINFREKNRETFCSWNFLPLKFTILFYVLCIFIRFFKLIRHLDFFFVRILWNIATLHAVRDKALVAHVSFFFFFYKKKGKVQKTPKF